MPLQVAADAHVDHRKWLACAQGRHNAIANLQALPPFAIYGKGRPMTQPHTIEGFVNVFGLTKKGREWVGPCPICKDGVDRVKEGTGWRNAQRTMTATRQCKSRTRATARDPLNVTRLRFRGHSVRRWASTTPEASKPGNSAQCAATATPSASQGTAQAAPAAEPRFRHHRYDYRDAQGKIAFRCHAA